MLYDIFALAVLFPAILAAIFFVALHTETILYYALHVLRGFIGRMKTWLLLQ